MISNILCNVNYNGIILFIGYFIFLLYFRNINNQKKYTIIDLAYKEKIEKELYFIKRIYKANIPIKYSRKYTSNTKYEKTKDIYKQENNTIKIISRYIKRRRKILLAIHSHISLFYHRYVFRKIYKNYNEVELIFFIGLDNNKSLNNLLFKEMIKNKDIVIFNFLCEYHNLHYLTYYFLTWIEKHKYLYEIIIKQDTDTFLNIELVKYITTNKTISNSSYVLGKIWFYHNKNRTYPSGMSYIFQSKSISKLLHNTFDDFSKLKYGYPEDQFFGYLARKANLIFYDSYIDFKYISYLQLPNFVFDCHNVFMIHSLRISEIAFLHFNITGFLN